MFFAAFFPINTIVGLDSSFRVLCSAPSTSIAASLSNPSPVTIKFFPDTETSAIRGGEAIFTTKASKPLKTLSVEAPEGDTHVIVALAPFPELRNDDVLRKRIIRGVLC